MPEKYDFVNKPKHYNGHKLKVQLPNGQKVIATYETIDLINSYAERFEKIGIPLSVAYKVLTSVKYQDRLAGGKPDGEKSIFEKFSEDLRKISWYTVHGADELDEIDLEKKEENPIKAVGPYIPTKIYISGKITGDDNWKKKFKAAELKLKEAYPNATILSPLITDKYAEDPNWTYEDFMHIDFALIDICDMVYFLDDWQDSPGAVREFDYVSGKKHLEFESEHQ